MKRNRIQLINLLLLISVSLTFASCSVKQNENSKTPYSNTKTDDESVHSTETFAETSSSGTSAIISDSASVSSDKPGVKSTATSVTYSTKTPISGVPTSSVGTSYDTTKGYSSTITSKSATQSKSTTSTLPSGSVMRFRKNGDKNTFGVWWWSIGTIKGSTGQKYLDFCVLNSVSEIYLCIDQMSETGSTSFADVRAFVKKAKSLGIRVAALTGDYTWIEPNNNGFQKYVDKFVAYQNSASADERFYSMHLDVEPHQHPDFRTGADGRARIMQLFANFAVNKAVPAAKSAGTLLEWDIPFWLTDVVKNPADNSNIILAELMAKYCDTICIMSYRDTATAMFNVSVEEIAYAKKYGCKIVLGAETYSQEGDAVSYMEEGKAYMAQELYKLNQLLLNEFPNRNFGLAVHNIQRWYDLKD